MLLTRKLPKYPCKHAKAWSLKLMIQHVHPNPGQPEELPPGEPEETPPMDPRPPGELPMPNQPDELPQPLPDEVPPEQPSELPQPGGQSSVKASHQKRWWSEAASQ